MINGRLHECMDGRPIAASCGQNDKHIRSAQKRKPVYMMRSVARAIRAISSSISCFSQQLNS